MEKFYLYDKFDIKKIDYIGIRKVSVFKPEYNIVISYCLKEFNIESTKTIDELKIKKELKEIKDKLKNCDGFISIDSYSPLVNIYRAKNVELKKCKYINKNYLKITLCNGQTLLTKHEPITSLNVNKWQLYNFKYWSKRNDHIHSK